MPTLVEIVTYDPDWPRDFERAAARLRAMLGGRVVAIDHIGSTAIPGLSAKPVVDIDVTVSGPGDIADASVVLVRAGFEPRGNRHADDIWAFLDRDSSPQLRGYLCPPENRTHQARMLFRNHLRQNPQTAAAYAALKTRLAARFPYDGDRYTSEKTAFIAGIVSGLENSSP
ncbi:GrpB family protein [Agrobacterium tumefaciens]|uniref:GrpB family protein n=1 Tax=Agrobacterium tumefaciens TaxID=358 RepID=UPI0021D00B03|nr:GrpB family protein [Agrobacterium tumefaciens]UXS01317.1 GrpB family protein [Agrobacterium tumefaciens]